MDVETTTSVPAQTGADTVCVGVFEGEDIARDADDGALQALVDSGEARRAFKKLAVTHAEGIRWILVGLGARDEFDAERARVSAAVAHGRAAELGARVLCWELPHKMDDHEAGGFVEGTVLASYRFDRYKRGEEGSERRLERLVVSDHEDRSRTVEEAAIVAEAQNAARELQDLPANALTPSALSSRAQELADGLEGLAAEAVGRDGIESLGMGAFAAVAQGSMEEPQLITLRYEGPGADGPVLGFVGKAVTFDSGGISLKQAAKMHEMKFDMSGGAAVIEAVGAIARLGLPVRLVAVVGATENLPGGRSVKPGDIVRAADGTTIEVNNTDAEGRMVLADCLLHAVAEGAERIVDLATLTGAIIVTLGSTYAGLLGSDDEWTGQVADAATATGELAWRLPLHPEYAEMIKGRYAEIVNATDERKAMSITAAEFLRRFAGDVPWAHLDIAGTAWGLGRPYAGKGGSGFGVRLLVELARRAG